MKPNLIPEAVTFLGIENKLPRNYSPTIKFTVREYEKSPDGKHDTYVTTDKHPKIDAVAAANIFHYRDQSVYLAKKYLYDEGYNVRKPDLLDL